MDGSPDLATSSRLLNLGCGGRFHPAWTNVDVTSTGPGVLACDLQKPLPFPDAHFDAVYHSHLLEHLPKSGALAFSRECFRVLRPGGTVRAIVPDLERIARLYLENLEGALAGDAAAEARYDWMMLELLDQVARDRPGGEMLEYWRQDPMPAEDFVVMRVGSEVLTTLRQIRGSAPPRPRTPPSPPEERDPAEVGAFRRSGEVHRWMYDRFSLARVLRESGFSGIRRCGARESSIPGFDAYLLDVEADGSVRKPDSLFMEGRRP